MVLLELEIKIAVNELLFWFLLKDREAMASLLNTE